MGIGDKLKKKAKEDVKNIHDKREAFENRAADKMDEIGKNETYIKLKNKGADELVEKGIELGIAIAESQSGNDIPISQETIDKIADKGGDGLVKIWDTVIGWFKKQLRK